VRLWQDSTIFDLVKDLIGSARMRVMVEMYELERADLLRALGAAVGRGVNVRVITDPTVTGNRDSTAVLDSMGVPERVYPVDDRRHQIDHVKLLVADGQAAIGGMNWGRHSDRNHDYVLETRVSVDVDRLVRIFEQDWSLAGGRPTPLAALVGDVAQTAPGAEIRAMLASALVHAMRRVLAEVYTLTDPEVLAELVDAHRRGATVRVLLDPHQPYNQHGYEVLRAGGVEVRWYRVPRAVKLHAKIGLFDGVLVLGSANWTLSGLGVNHELDIETGDPVAVETYATRFAADWTNAGG
jgi:phosphatidylserine/phosphatidylglycerophosphate/cardiolipin synthase-like enzyme